jgi:hypothetical protein
MNARELAALHAKLAGNTQLALPPVRVCGFEAHSEILTDAVAVEQAVVAFQPRFGSLLRTGARIWLGAGETPEVSAADGPVLDAELVGADGRCLQIRHLGGRWRKTLVIHLPVAEDCVADEVERRGQRPAPQKLRYRRYWRVIEGRDTEPVMAVLIEGELA